jgi:hypothetical protein
MTLEKMEPPDFSNCAAYSTAFDRLPALPITFNFSGL